MLLIGTNIVYIILQCYPEHLHAKSRCSPFCLSFKDDSPSSTILNAVRISITFLYHSHINSNESFIFLGKKLTLTDFFEEINNNHITSYKYRNKIHTPFLIANTEGHAIHQTPIILFLYSRWSYKC